LEQLIDNGQLGFSEYMLAIKNGRLILCTPAVPTEMKESDWLNIGSRK